MIQIDRNEALRLLEEVSGGKGDYVYQPPLEDTSACYNVFDGQPSCIVGHALVRAGVEVSWLEENARWGGVGATAFGLQEGGVAALTRGAVAVFALAQALQDTGATWGTAVLAARVGAELDWGSE